MNVKLRAKDSDRVDQFTLMDLRFDTPNGKCGPLFNALYYYPPRKSGWHPSLLRIVTHRIVPGASLKSPVAIKADDHGALPQLEQLCSLAPLHNIPATQLIRELLPRFVEECKSVNDSGSEDSRQVGPMHLAYLDTAFHSTIPAHLSLLPVPSGTIIQGLPLGQAPRRWGFHGIAYECVVEQVARYLGKPKSGINLLAAHLGGGSSVCAIINGKSFDTTMGFTPLEGLPGATRSGVSDLQCLPDKRLACVATHCFTPVLKSVDPCLGYHLSSQSATMMGEDNISRSEYILNMESGLKAITGDTGDFREITRRMSAKLTEEPTTGEQELKSRAQLAFDYYEGEKPIKHGRGCMLTFSGI